MGTLEAPRTISFSRSCSGTSSSSSSCQSQSLADTCVILGGHRVSFADFCEDGQDVGVMEQLRRETVDKILSAKTHYAVLGLLAQDRGTAAFRKILQEAYLEMSLIVHPAECHLDGAEAAFVRLATAYDTLQDTEARLKYDRSIGLRIPREFKEAPMTLFNSTELLAQALHEAIVAHDLTVPHTVLHSLSNMLLWVDGYLNPQIERRRQSNRENEDEDDEADDFVMKQLQEQRQRRRVGATSNRLAETKGQLGQSWRCEHRQSLTPPHRKIHGDTYLGWMARKVASYDTALGSLWVLTREGVRRQRKKIKDHKEEQHRGSEKADLEQATHEERPPAHQPIESRWKDSDSATATEAGLRGSGIVDILVEAMDQDIDLWREMDVEVDD